MLAVDIEGAFDRVWHEGLMVKLKSVGIGGKMLKLLKDYLTDRSLRVTINGQTSKQYPIRAGVPQGSVLGPLMWTLFFNDCLNLFPESDAYAHDLTLSVSCRPSQLKEFTVRFSKRLDLLVSWGSLWQVKFATNKTSFMVIWRSPVSSYLRFGRSFIENTNEIEISGLIYEKNLTFSAHIRFIARKAGGKSLV